MQQIPQGGSKVERPSMSEIERIQRYNRENEDSREDSKLL